MWREDVRAYFPRGSDDPTIALFKVEIENGESWDSASRILARAIAYAKALTTGEKPHPGADEQAKVQPWLSLRHPSKCREPRRVGGFLVRAAARLPPPGARQNPAVARFLAYVLAVPSRCGPGQGARRPPALAR